MARYEVAPLPRGYTIAPFAGRFYPIAIEMGEYPYVRMNTFTRPRGGTISYAKRSLAAQFLTNYAAGKTGSARIDTRAQAQDNGPLDVARRA